MGLIPVFLTYKLSIAPVIVSCIQEGISTSAGGFEASWVVVGVSSEMKEEDAVPSASEAAKENRA